MTTMRMKMKKAPLQDHCERGEKKSFEFFLFVFINIKKIYSFYYFSPPFNLKKTHSIFFFTLNFCVQCDRTNFLSDTAYRLDLKTKQSILLNLIES